MHIYIYAGVHTYNAPLQAALLQAGHAPPLASWSCSRTTNCSHAASDASQPSEAAEPDIDMDLDMDAEPESEAAAPSKTAAMTIGLN